MTRHWARVHTGIIFDPGLTPIAHQCTDPRLPDPTEVVFSYE